MFTLTNTINNCKYMPISVIGLMIGKLRSEIFTISIYNTNRNSCAQFRWSWAKVAQSHTDKVIDSIHSVAVSEMSAF